MEHTNPRTTSSSPGLRSLALSSCQACEENDTEDMVQCDVCDRWLHFSCAGVSDSIAENDFVCTKCKASGDAVSTRSGTTSKHSQASTLAKQHALMLQKLEEEKQQAKQFLDKKYEILYQLANDEGDPPPSNSDQGGISSWATNPTAPMAQSMYSTVKTLRLPTSLQLATASHITGGNASATLANSTPARTLPFVQREVPVNAGATSVSTQHTTSDKYNLNLNKFNVHECKLPFTSSVPGYAKLAPPVPLRFGVQSFPTGLPSLTSTTVDARVPLSTSNQFNLLGLPQPVNSIMTHGGLATSQSELSGINNALLCHGGLPQVDPLVNINAPCCGVGGVHGDSDALPNRSSGLYEQYNCSMTNPNAQPAITQFQLAARHAIPKDLPYFNGNPYEWPIFISSFEGSTRACGFSNEENLFRLQKCLKGRALEAVRSRLLLPQMVPQVIETLRLLYGRPEIIIQSLIQSIRNQPSPKAERLETLIPYALSVQNLCSTIEASGLTAHLCNPILLQELVDKLPAHIKLSWAMFKQSLPNITLAVLGNWLFHIAQAASEVTMPQLNFSPEIRSTKERSFVHTHAECDGAIYDSRNSRDQFRPKPHSFSVPTQDCDRPTILRDCVICKDGNHGVAHCKKFKGMNYPAKWTAVRTHKLCRKCLIRHNQITCKVDKTCGENGCPYRHHPLLHNPKPIAEASSNAQFELTQELPSCNAHQQLRQTTLFRILPVTLHGKGVLVKTFAFLDEGSSVTLLEGDVADELGLEGTREELCLKWTGDNVRVEKDSRRLSLRISGTYDNAKAYTISNVRTVKKLSLPKQSISLQELREKYSHLKDITFESYNNAVPRVLLGIDNWRLGLPLEFSEGKIGDPVATKTRLGWEVHGRCEEAYMPDTDTTSSQHDSFHVCNCNPEEDLHQLVKDYFSVENIGVKIPDVMPSTKEHKRAIEIMKSTTLKKKDRYETGLLWKYDRVTLPDSYNMAYQRFTCLEKQMSKNPALGQRIEETIQGYLRKGYIRKLTEEELKTCNPRTWYLPLFTVKNPNKPDKLRIVWDAAARVNDISLNSVLLRGPDELTALLDVLFKFREHAFAVTGDIREMFHQVLIREEDQQAQRFLWKSDRNQSHPDVYVLQVMTFGAACSPSLAQYVKNYNASRYADEFPKAAKAIVANHYVDDMLVSAETEKEVIAIAKGVRYIHSQGGFEIRNWVSNSQAVLGALGGSEGAILKNIAEKKEPAAERVLGLLWNTSTDTFSFPLAMGKTKHDVLTGKRHPTKREVLKTLMSIFDPLGLLSPLIVQGKILLKDIWRSALDWDDQLGYELYHRWLIWLQCLEGIRELYVPRCYCRASVERIYSIQLHVFVDAGESAYAAVAYFRIETLDGIECSLVSAKTKVTPQKPISIPRLELQAAVLGTRLASSILKAHSLKIDGRYMWSDSRTVLSWLRSDPTKYRQFVAFRIGEILETTNLAEWRWIPSKLNVADDATKSPNSGRTLDSSHRWFKGPAFLMENAEHWPTEETQESVKGAEELRPHFTHAPYQTDALIDLERFSKWSRLLRTLAYVYRFISNTKTGSQRTLGPLTQQEYTLAQNKLYQIAQLDSYPTEIAILHKNRTLDASRQIPIEKHSPIYKRSPYLDNLDILRVKGRIDAARNVPYDVKRPIILPKRHTITRLLVDHFHRKYHHHNHETVINEIRQTYDIPTLRVILKRIVRTCQMCKNSHAVPKSPEMAGLPSARLGSYTMPFAFVGIDYFGPMFVTVGRHMEKRWGVLFTCLTVRAIHIEIAYSLSTDSCILAMRNFAARRGTPREIRTDNGTNFRGANEELRRELRKIDESRLQEDVFGDSPVVWVFNPPAAPHMGGSWERLVQSVKKTLKTIMPMRNPNDELLRSLLMEVEAIVNSRPLTYIPLETFEQEALTPNHFLLGASSGQKPPGVFDDNPLALRKDWKISQYLANEFWRRWVREYLPDLTKRTKWFKSVNPIREGDIVIIVDESQPRNTWRRGRVLETLNSRSGQVRQAIVQTNSGVLTRPAVKLAVLDVASGTDSCTGKMTECSQYTGRENVAAKQATLDAPTLVGHDG